MSQISKCSKVTKVLTYWEASVEVSEPSYKSLLYFSSNGSHCRLHKKYHNWCWVPIIDFTKNTMHICTIKQIYIESYIESQYSKHMKSTIKCLFNIHFMKCTFPSPASKGRTDKSCIIFQFVMLGPPIRVKKNWHYLFNIKIQNIYTVMFFLLIKLD